MPGLGTYPRILILAAVGGLTACSGQIPQHGGSQLVAKIGDPELGRATIVEIGCGTCHEIPGIRGAIGRVGPPLTGIAVRGYLAGVLRNTPAAMVHWIRFPQSVVPGNAMPDMGLSEEEARNVTAYLYTLR